MLEYAIGARTRFSEILSNQSLIADGELLAARESPASAEVAEALGLPEATPVEVLEILRRADGLPVSVTTSHLPASRFRGIEAAFRETNSITAALRMFGVADYTRRSTRIWTRMPTPRGGGSAASAHRCAGAGDGECQSGRNGAGDRIRHCPCGGPAGAGAGRHLSVSAPGRFAWLPPQHARLGLRVIAARDIPRDERGRALPRVAIAAAARCHHLHPIARHNPDVLILR